MRILQFGRDQPTGMTAVLRFKAISANPATTEIALQNLRVHDEMDQPIETEVPPAATIQIQ